MSASVETLYRTEAPNGAPIEIPVRVEEDDEYRALSSPDAVKNYFERHGYVVIRGLVSRSMCDAVREAFASEVKPYDGYIYRQATANPEKHRFTDRGFMLNSILNIQDLDSRLFPGFKRRGLDVITHRNMQEAVSQLFGEPGKIVQSMFFDGNSETWPHQDTYYLDSERLGTMVGAWIAVEDIAPGAGRFFVCPGSHRIDMQKNGGDFDIAFNHERYKKLIIDVIDSKNLSFHAPAMAAGDVLFWSAKTIHGSLKTTQPEHSRASLTAHFIPESHRFMQFQSRIKLLNLRDVNGIQVHHPKSQEELRNRVILRAETRFPRLFQTMKKVAVKAMTS